MTRILKVVVLNITTTAIKQDEQNFDFLFQIKKDATITKKQKPAPPQKNIPTVKPLGATVSSQNNPEIATKLEELSSDDLIKMAKTFKAQGAADSLIKALSTKLAETVKKETLK